MIPAPGLSEHDSTGYESAAREKTASRVTDHPLAPESSGAAIHDLATPRTSPEHDCSDNQRAGDTTWLATRIDEVTSALEALNDLVRDCHEFPLLLQHVCAHVADVLPGGAEVSITMLSVPGAPRTVTGTSDTAVRLDRSQYDAGHGPCLDAGHSGAPVRAGVRHYAGVLPGFAELAGEAGLRSVLSLPLVIDRNHSGTINCYREAADAPTDLDARLLELYVTAVEGILGRRCREHGPGRSGQCFGQHHE